MTLLTKPVTPICFANCVVGFRICELLLQLFGRSSVVDRVGMGSGEGAGSADYSEEYGSNNARA